MTTLREEIEKHIRKLILPLKEEEELKEVLKVRLTKKEFKLLQGWAEDTSQADLMMQLHLDEESKDMRPLLDTILQLSAARSLILLGMPGC